MKKLSIIICILLGTFTNISAESVGLIDNLYNASPLCLIQNAKKISTRIDKYKKIDKFKHCATTCQLALKCSSLMAISAGALKELLDTITPGDADLKDMRANLVGKSLVDTKMATTNNECIQSCDSIDWITLLEL